MPNLTGLTTNFFPTPNEGFTTTTSGPVDSSSATVVPLNSVSGLTNGSIYTGLIDPGNAKERAFTGVVDTGGSQITSVKFTTGTNATHTTGATVVDYVTGTHIGQITKGISVSIDQDGTLKESAVREALNLGTASTSGWEVEAELPDTITYNGNRSYDLVFNSTDLTDTLSEGMRLRLTRTVSAPTQCTDLESSSSQYWNDTSVSGMTFTDDFVAGAWVKLESYGSMSIASRYNGTSGWRFFVGADGRVYLQGTSGGASNFRRVVSYQSLPLGRWVHVTAQLDMSAYTATATTCYMMFDGVDIPVNLETSGTNPTALTQAGNLEIGSENGGSAFFDGKIAQAFVSSAKITQANVRTLISQGLTASLISTHSIVSAYSFDGNANDLNTTNANNLTAQGSAVATNVDSPFGNYLGGTLEYAIISAKPTFSTNTTVTVQVPEGCAIPTSGGISAVSYSTNATPYGYPGVTNIVAESRLQINATATSQAQVNGFSLTATLSAGQEYRVRVFGASTYNSSSATNTIIRVWDGTVGSGTNMGAYVSSSPSANNQQAVYLETPAFKATGSKTYNVSLEGNGGGTSTLACSSTNPAAMVLERVPKP